MVISLRCIEIVKVMAVVFLILPLSYSLSITSTPALVISNKDTPDVEYAKMIMDKYYLKRKIQILNESAVDILERKVEYVPILDNKNLSLDKGRYKLYIEYEIENNSKLRYKEIILSFKITNDNEIDFLGKKYEVLNRDDKKLILYTSVKKIATNSSFNYSDYRIIPKLVSVDNQVLVVDIHKNNILVEKNVELRKGKVHYLDEKIALLYEGVDKRKFIIKIYNIAILEDGKDFSLNRNFTVSLSEDKINLIYRDPENVKGPLSIYNYHIKMVNSTLFKYFRITYINNYKVSLEDRDMVDFGEGAYLIKNDSEMFILKDGKVFNRSLVEYYTPDILPLDSENLLTVNCNIILVGGPEANKLTKDILKYLKVPITREYPGKHVGVIQTIENPYNPNYSIMVVAGSDRWGTKASVMALVDGVYREGDVIYVEWINNTYRVLS